MADYTITVTRNSNIKKLNGTKGVSLLDTLIENDIYISAACGGAGKCGKCKVRMTENATEVTDTDKKFFDEEKRPQKEKEG